jgi:hypothetical protein
VTYPDLCVAAALNEFFVPLQLNVDEAKETAKKFRVMWTPNINLLDGEGNLFYHVEGWLPPSEFSAMLMAAHGRHFLLQENYSEAWEIFHTVWDKYPRSSFTPEALYYFGVAKYLQSHKAEDLVEGWQTLQRYHPQSSWGIRSSVV